MKKIATLILAVLLLINFSSCLNPATSLFKSDSDQATERAAVLFTAIENKDKQACEKLFAKKVRNSQDFDKQIEELFEYFDGKVVSYEENGLQTSSSSEEGEQSKEYYSSFELKSDRTNYRVALLDVIYDDFDSDNCGIHSLYIIKANEDTDLTYSYWGDHEYTKGINIGIKNKLQ